MAARRQIRALERTARTPDALRGTRLGHAVHPMLTDLPLGAWMCTTLVDLFGGHGPAPPLRDCSPSGWPPPCRPLSPDSPNGRGTKGSARRVGVAHAGANTVALVLYGMSLLARRRDRQALGVALALGGGVVVLASGYLGGHMSFVDKVGSGDPGWSESRAGGEAPLPVDSVPTPH